MLSFLHPPVLLALLGLPLLWRLLSALPPAPRRMVWPPLALFGGLRARIPPMRRPPWWLVLLRCLLLAALIVAAAGPQWRAAGNDDAKGGGADDGGTILLLIDDGFPSAEDWEARRRLVRRLLDRFGEDGMRFVLLGTAPRPGDGADGRGRDVRIERLATVADALAARAALESMTPSPFLPDHAGIADLLRGLAADRRLPDDLVRILWIRDGMRWKGSDELAGVLARLAPVARVRMTVPAGGGPYALLPPEPDAQGGWRLVVVRPPGRPAASVEIIGLTREGMPLGSVVVRLAAGATRVAAQWKARTSGLSLDRFALRDATAARSAARVWRLDRRSRTLRIGIVAGPQDSARPFAAPVYYLERALRPAGEVSIGGLEDLLARAPDVLVIADRPALAAPLARRLADWLAHGGLLIRFAGPAYGNETDSLHPLPLARGARVVGGRLSWERPKHPASFPADGPFAGLRIPDGVAVRGQVLALPGGGAKAAVLVRLDDGTPLISSAVRGRGRIVFFHTGADARWTNLPLDPLFAALLRRVLWLAPAAAPADGAMEEPEEGDPDAPLLAPGGLLAAQLVLDGFGALVPPPMGVRAIPLARIDTTPVAPMTPAGLYGAPEHPFVRNLQGPPGIGVIDPGFRFVPARGPWTDPRLLIEGGRRDLAGPLVLFAFLLLLVDLAATGRLRGWGRRLSDAAGRRSRSTGGAGSRSSRLARLLVPAALLTTAAAFSAFSARAQGDDASFAIAATRETRIGYIATGDAVRDERVRAGLSGLARLMRLRTSVRLAEPMAVDPARHPLALFALVYWMPKAGDPPLAPAAANGIARYLAAGGILFVDLGMQDDAGSDGDVLSRLLGGLPVPSLVPLDDRHILARSFYLLDWFPGRREGAPVWVAAASVGDEPKVSPIIIGRNDWVGAWALRGDGGFLVPELAGGLEQREYAFRFGVNLVIYALAGTYKGDQIHLDAILERLKR